MNFNVKVSGIPTHANLGKLVPLFSNILSMRSNNFFLRILASKGPVKDVMLSVLTYSEAHSALVKLNNFVYKHNNTTYILTAAMSDGYKKKNKNPESRHSFPNTKLKQQYGYQHEEQFPQERPHSPHYADATSHLDMQIEILRKQRLIIEEERKLLEEQRKLDQLKMISYNNEITTVENRICGDVPMSGPSSNVSEKKSIPKQLTFHQASGVLMRKMNMFVSKHSSLQERNALFPHLRSLLKQRLAAVVAEDGQGVYQTHKVILLYRAQYPTSEDEEFVKEALKDIREGRSTADTETVKASGTGANVTNDPDGTMSVAGDNALQEGNAKDTTISDDSNVAENSENKGQENTETKFEAKRLFFYKATSALIKKMNIHMDKHTQPEKRKLLVEYLRSTIKQRFADIVAGQPIYQTHKLLKMYRSEHPVTEDEDFIKQLIKNIDEGIVSEDTFIKNKKTKVDSENDAEKNALNNDTSDIEMIIVEDVNEKTGLCDDKESTNIFKKAESENIIDLTEEVLTNEDNIKEGSENDTIAEETDSQIDNASNKDVVSENTEDIVESNVENNNAIDDINADAEASDATQNCSGDVTVEEENRGVKRKNCDDEDSLTKAAKTDDPVVTENEWVDWE